MANPESQQPVFGLMGNPEPQQAGFVQVNNSSESQSMYNQLNQPPKKKSVGLIIVLVLLIVAILGAGGYAIYYFTQSDDTEEKDDKNKKDEKDEKDEKDDEEGGSTDDEGGNTSNDEKVKFLGAILTIPSEYEYEVSGNKLTVSDGLWYTQINEYSLSYDQLQSVKEEFVAKLNETSSVSNYYNKKLNGYECFIIEGTVNSYKASFIFTDLNSSTTLQITIMNLNNTQVNSSVYDDIMKMFP